MNISVQCRVCGGVITLSQPETGEKEFDEILKRIGASVVHDGCHQNRKGEMRRQELEQIESRRATEWCGICPPIYQDSIPGNIPDQAAFTKIMAWEFAEKGLTLFGATGCGKTRSMFCLLAREFEKERRILAYTHTEFARQTVALIDNRHSLDRWLSLVARVDILFIDDLGKSKFTDFNGDGRKSEELLFDMFEKRIGNKLPTMWTTEHSGETLKQAMSAERGPSFVRRLREFTTAIAFNNGEQKGQYGSTKKAKTGSG